MSITGTDKKNIARVGTSIGDITASLFCVIGVLSQLILRNRLNRGSKLTELLKQDQYSPMTVAEQVVTIYAGVKGYLDSIETAQIRPFEKGLLELVKNEKPEILDNIQKSGKIDEQIDKVLSELITNYKRDNFEKK